MTADMQPSVSVVCSTYQRAHRLPSLFAALERQTFDRAKFEVVIVDDGSTDGAAEVLSELAAASPLTVRLVIQPQNRGVAVGRNAGVAAASAPVIAFTDDDCAPSPGWLQAGLDAMQSSGAAIVVGSTQPNPEQAANNGPFSRTISMSADTANFLLATCNIFYKRDDFVSIGGFNEDFKGKGGGEDTDLGWRLLDAGAESTFAPDALVWHDIDPGTFRTAVKQARTAQALPRLVRLHPRRARPKLTWRIFWGRHHLVAFLAVVGLLLAAVLRNPLPLVSVLPALDYRLRVAPLHRGRLQRFVYVWPAVVVDVIEFGSAVVGSIRNRTVVL